MLDLAGLGAPWSLVSTCINRGVIHHGLADAAELMAPAVIVKLPVVGLAELVRRKRAAGRHKDLDDVEHLEPVLGRSQKK